MNLPAELTEFIPEKVKLGVHRSWELTTNAFGNNIEIRNAIFSGQMKAFVAAIVGWMMLIGGIIIWALIFVIDMPKLGDVPDWVLRTFFVVKAFLACTVVTGIFIAVFLHQAYSNALLWKEKLRFRYDKTSGELFFSRENARYSRNDYKELILGITEGYDTVSFLKEIEQYKVQTGTKHVPTSKHAIQSYFLVRWKDGTWVRHLVGFDPYSKSTRRTIEKIQKVMQCPMAKRTMSLPECYATQHKVADPEAQLKAPPKMNLFVFYLIPPFFMIIGLCLAGMQINEFRDARASWSWSICEGTITHSTVECRRSTGSGKSRIGTTWGADIRYEYTVDGKRYTDNRYCFGDYSSSDSSRAKRIVAEHPIGSAVKVYYAPTSPNKSVLVPGTNFMVFLKIGFGALFFFAGLGALFLLRSMAKRDDLSAPYVPSEAVLLPP
jgi:hypothetical protein